MMTHLKPLLECLLKFSARAEKLAHAIRENPVLFSLLVEEKSDEEKNKKFTHDFKTLADVLIQESLRHYVSKEFPVLEDHVKGEESATFTNTLGEKITVKVCDTQNETADLLSKILNGNLDAATVLSHIVHEEIERPIENHLKDQIPESDITDFGIWIDPIDSTAEYVKGSEGKEKYKIYEHGLPCVTVLIGVYNRINGLPVLGVVNHPFYEKDNDSSRWNSEIFWGICLNGITINNLKTSPLKSDERKKIVISSTEDSSVIEKLNNEFLTIPAAGAGYKCMIVVLGLADAYFYSKNSTYKWDTNAPHALLRSLGGGIIDLKKFNETKNFQEISEDDLTSIQLKYHEGIPKEDGILDWANSNGLIAYRSKHFLSALESCLT